MRQLAVSAAIALLAGCSAQPQLSASDAWVRLAAVDGRPAAAYFALHGGPTDTALVAVSSAQARRVELHESMAASNGGMTMESLASVPVPAGTTLAFAPTGRHAMLFGVNPAIKAGGTMTLTFTFSGGETLRTDARVVSAGEDAPAPR